MSEAQIDSVKFDDILRKVRGLIAKADHPNTPDLEADTLRTKAEALMLKYRIEEATAYESAKGSGLEPTWTRMGLYTVGSEFSRYYRMLAGSVMTHVGGRGLTDYDGNEVFLEMCGFATDLRYGEVLMTSALLAFSKRLEPKPDVNATDHENAWNLRAAGWERKRIARVLFGDWTTENEMKAKNRKVTRLIKEYGPTIGEDPNMLLGRGNNMETFRESYAQGFVNTLNSRLWNMRREATEELGGGLVPVSRKEAVDEAFYTRYPQYRPKETEASTDSGREGCIKCARASSGYCRDHQYLKPSTAQARGPRINRRAYDRGRAAAYDIDLGRSGAGNRIGDQG